MFNEGLHHRSYKSNQNECKLRTKNSLIEKKNSSCFDDIRNSFDSIIENIPLILLMVIVFCFLFEILTIIKLAFNRVPS